MFGTSASSPFVGGIIQQINGERLTAGKSTVGFLNPTLYQNPDVLNDITTGDNPGCGTDGFSAVEGWVSLPIYLSIYEPRAPVISLLN